MPVYFSDLPLPGSPKAIYGISTGGGVADQNHQICTMVLFSSQMYVRPPCHGMLYNRILNIYG